MTVSQADQLLLGPSGKSGVELDARAEALLTTVRAEDQAIRDESTVSDEKRSSLLKTVLTGMGWDDRLIADVLGAEGLGNTLADYEAPLDLMPTGITLPTSLIYHDARKLLVVHLPRPQTMRENLAPLLTNNQISSKVRRALRLISAGNNEARLDLMPIGITLPPSFTYHDATKRLVVSHITHPKSIHDDITNLLTNNAVSGDLRVALESISAEAVRRIKWLDEAATRRSRLLRCHELFCTFIPSIPWG